MTQLVTSTMKYSNCNVHANCPQNYVCTHLDCECTIMCEVCSQLHKHHGQYVMTFRALQEKYRTDRLQYLNLDVRDTLGNLKELVKAKSTLNESQRLYQQIKISEEWIRRIIQDRIQGEINGMKKSLEQKKKDLPTYINKLFDGDKVKEKIDDIIQQLEDEEQVVKTFDKEIKKKKEKLENWVTRGLEQVGELNTEIKIIADVIVKRKNELGKQLDNDFMIIDRAEQKKYNSQFNTSDLKGKSQQMKKQMIKKILWENQRLENQLQRTKARLMKLSEKIISKNQEFVDLENKMHFIQIQLAQKKQIIKDRDEAEQKESIKKLEDQKKEKHQFQTMLVKKGVENYINPKVLNLRAKGITSNQLNMIIKEIKGLTSLDLSQNQIELEDLRAIFKIQGLQSLKLCFMKIDKQFIYKIANDYRNTLTQLHLDSNNLHDSNVYDIIQMKNLHTLSLVDNNITDLGANQISMRLKLIRKLYLSYNKISQKGADELARSLFELEQLHMTRNPIKNKGVHSISANCKALVQLNVGGCELSKEGAVYIAKGCPKLERLSIGNNTLQADSIIQLIMYLPQLTLLEISYCELQIEDIDKIKKVSKMNPLLHLKCQQ